MHWLLVGHTFAARVSFVGSCEECCLTHSCLARRMFGREGLQVLSIKAARPKSCQQHRGYRPQDNLLPLIIPACCASPGGDTTVRVWHASDLSFVRVLRGHRGSILCLLAVNNMLLSGSRDNTIR